MKTKKSMEISPTSLYLSQPPNNEKTKLKLKTYTELNNLTPVQEIKCGSDAIWIIKFRSDGLYLATAGKEGVLRIWKTTDTHTDICIMLLFNSI